ncbi:hypothetical protein K438DRAFT_1955346 [Mycena galopus ATCC 62051]|nr:hypothetical protein K438DRAFT_1955346 [Mycena galopus ATCC 62051]
MDLDALTLYHMDLADEEEEDDMDWDVTATAAAAIVVGVMAAHSLLSPMAITNREIPGLHASASCCSRSSLSTFQSALAGPWYPSTIWSKELH